MPGARRSGRVAIIGAGPGGMAAAIAVHRAGHDVLLFERHPASRPAGNILNLWPPPLKALAALGMDIDDLGAPCDTEFRRADGRVRAVVRIPEEVKRRYGGGFIGLLRPELYERMTAALPDGVLRVNRELVGFEQNPAGVTGHFANGERYECDVLVGADGIDSIVRRALWGERPKREHRLHIVGGFCFPGGLGTRGRCVVGHDRDTQCSWTSIRYHGRDGYQWWVLRSWDPGQAFDENPLEYARRRVSRWPEPLPSIVAATDADDVQRWVIRDRRPLKRWSKGRVTLLGDAAHPTSPYAAYGAGMAIEDGYFLGRRLTGIQLTDPAQVTDALRRYERPRRPHTRQAAQTAWVLGKVFHHAPRPLQVVRDLVFDHTPVLQKAVGDSQPATILSQLAAIDDPSNSQHPYVTRRTP